MKLDRLFEIYMNMLILENVWKRVQLDTFSTDFTRKYFKLNVFSILVK